MSKILRNLRAEIKNPKKFFIVKTPKTLEIERIINIEMNTLSQVISFQAEDVKMFI